MRHKNYHEVDAKTHAELGATLGELFGDKVAPRDRARLNRLSDRLLLRVDSRARGWRGNVDSHRYEAVDYVDSVHTLTRRHRVQTSPVLK
jgi:hypothetical protein